MRILIVEDTVMKYVEISRVLRGLCDAQIDNEKALEPAKEMFDKAGREDEPYHLVITDMHFPIESGGEEVPDAGYQLIEYIQKEQPELPIIICSSVRYSGDGVAGCVLYSDKTDLRAEFSKILSDVLK